MPAKIRLRKVQFLIRTFPWPANAGTVQARART